MPNEAPVYVVVDEQERRVTLVKAPTRDAAARRYFAECGVLADEVDVDDLEALSICSVELFQASLDETREVARW